MRAITTFALTAAALVATALPASAQVATALPASAQVKAAVTISSHGRLEARGAAVTVPITVMCERGATGSLSVQVTQNVRGEIAAGEKYVPIRSCTGKDEKVNVTVVSRTKAFRLGVAFTSASLYVYTPTESSVVERGREVMLVR